MEFKFLMNPHRWQCSQCTSKDIEWIADLDGADPYDYYVCLDCGHEDQKNYFKRSSGGDQYKI